MTTLVCVCGHHFDEHRHGVIMNQAALERTGEGFRNVGGLLGGGCEATQFEGRFFKKPECYCDSYWDKGWPERKKT